MDLQHFSGVKDVSDLSAAITTSLNDEAMIQQLLGRRRGDQERGVANSGEGPRFVRGYVRVSTEEQARSGYSIKNQREQLENWCKAFNMTLVKVYADPGISAKDLNRPGLQQLLSEAQPGEIILIHKLDRLTRSLRDLDFLLQLFAERQYVLESITEKLNTDTAAGRMLVNIIGVVAQWERETIGERAREGKRKRVENGEWNGGIVPFGYIAIPSGEVKRGRNLLKLVPDPKLRHIVTEIFERYLAGHGMRSIAIWLNDEVRVSTTNGGRWRVTSLVRVLTNPIYAGYITHGRQTKGDIIVKKSRYFEEMAIISLDTYKRVQEIFDRRKTYAPRQATGKYPLAGTARCGQCGANIVMLKQGKYYYYRCADYVNGRGCGTPPLTSVSGRIVESTLVKLIDQLQLPEHADKFLEEYRSEYQSRVPVTEAEIQRINSDITESEHAIRRWDRAFETGKLEFEDYLARVQQHKERIATLKSKLEEIERQPLPPERDALVAFSRNFSAVWNSLEPHERKAMLQDFTKAFRVQILLHPNRRVELRPER